MQNDTLFLCDIMLGSKAHDSWDIGILEFSHSRVTCLKMLGELIRTKYM